MENPLPPAVKRLLGARPEEVEKELGALPLEKLLAPSPVASAADAELIRAAIWLKHGFLDAAHRVMQKVPTPEGSWWHGIMHRREGDLANSRYWYDRVGKHPLLGELGGYPADAAAEQREFDRLLAHTLARATGASSP